ncbi:MAG: SDR family oxidoreductase [Vicinamibacterales bacterium]
MRPLLNAVSLVTGSSRGIGRATALRLARAGSDVCINYLNSPREAREVAEEVSRMGRRAVVVKADLSAPEDVSSLMDILQSEFGRLDILVSNAAGGGFTGVLETSLAQFDYAMRVNVQAFMLLAQYARPLFERTALQRAKLISVSSLGGTRVMPHYGLVGTAKGAIESMTRHLALELGPRGVNVNCVCAGLVMTGALTSHPDRESIVAAQRRRSLAGDEGIAPEDVADAITFLCSSAADKIQGQTVVIDAGTSILS